MLLSNQIRCTKCGDTPYSAHRHDYKKCKCGATFVDGGMVYSRHSVQHTEDMSIYIDDSLAGSVCEAISEAINTNRNPLGILCFVARTLRDNGYEIKEKEK